MPKIDLRDPMPRGLRAALVYRLLPSNAGRLAAELLAHAAEQLTEQDVETFRQTPTDEHPAYAFLLLLDGVGRDLLIADVPDEPCIIVAWKDGVLHLSELASRFVRDLRTYGWLTSAPENDRVVWPGERIGSKVASYRKARRSWDHARATDMRLDRDLVQTPTAGQVLAGHGVLRR